VDLPTVLDPSAGVQYFCCSADDRLGAFRRSRRCDPFLCFAAGEFFVPNIKSSKKDLRKSRAAAVRNRAQRSALRTSVKKAKTEGADAGEQLSAVSLLDRSARKGLIHRNTAARQKSQIAKLAAKSV